MTSRDVKNFINDGEAGVKKLYKEHVKYFNIVDEWKETLTNGDLLNEYEITSCMERLTGCLMALGSVAGALESIKEEMEHGTRVKEFGKLDKVNQPACDIVKAKARDKIKDIRNYASDFRNYFYAAQSGVTTAQSRLKRLTVTKGAKGIAFIGETPVEEEKTKEQPSGDPINKEGTTSNNTVKKPNRW